MLCGADTPVRLFSSAGVAPFLPGFGRSGDFRKGDPEATRRSRRVANDAHKNADPSLQPRSGARTQPTAQAVGEKRKMSQPQRGERGSAWVAPSLSRFVRQGGDCDPQCCVGRTRLSAFSHSRGVPHFSPVLGEVGIFERATLRLRGGAEGWRMTHTKTRTRAFSREAAQERSPRRKPWVKSGK